MDQPIITPEAVQPETVTTITPEATPIAEMIPSSPVQPDPVIPAQAGIQTVDPEILRHAQNDSVEVEPPAAEVADAISSNVPSSDNNWIGKVKEAIHEDADQPFKEEEDAEILNKDYQQQRFGVSVDKEGK